MAVNPLRFAAMKQASKINDGFKAAPVPVATTDKPTDAVDPQAISTSAAPPDQPDYSIKPPQAMTPPKLDKDMGMSRAGGGFDSNAAGSKQYGASGAMAPNMGPSTSLGYRERDMAQAAKQTAIQNTLKRFNAVPVERVNLNGERQN